MVSMINKKYIIKFWRLNMKVIGFFYIRNIISGRKRW